MAAADHAELKHLQRRRDEAEALVKSLKDQRKELDEEIGRKAKIITKLDADIKAIKDRSAENGVPVVSEHAMLRYIERVMGMDLDDIKHKVLGGKTDFIKTLGTGVYPADTHKIKVQKGVVVTILTEEDK